MNARRVAEHVDYDADHDVLYVWLAAQRVPSFADEVMPGILIERAITVPRNPKVGFVVMDARRRADRRQVRRGLLRAGIPIEVLDRTYPETKAQGR